MRLAFPFALLSLLALACGGNVVIDGAGAGGSVTPPFACGTTTCAAGDFCEAHPPGVEAPEGGVPSGAYTCSPLPVACASTPTCACLAAAISSGDPCSPSFGATCSVDAEGNVSVVCLDA